MYEKVDYLIVGAGVIGLAIARELSIIGKEVIVAETESKFGTHTSSRNSEVIHAGIYYPRNSLKAKLCVQGKKLLYAYCKERKIDHKKIGKIIVAKDTHEESFLNEYFKKAFDNNVKDLRFLNKKELSTLEPNIVGQAALYSPSSGIIDSHTLMLNLIGDIENSNGLVVFNSKVTKIKKEKDFFWVHVDGIEQIILKVKNFINCAGLKASEVANLISGVGKIDVPKTFLSKAHYFAYSGKSPFKHLIYPVAKKSTQNMGTSLGIHVTLDLSGRARFGPDSSWINEINYDFENSKIDNFLKSIIHYYPEVEKGKLLQDYTGIRPKISGPNEPAKDFYIQTPLVNKVEGLYNLFGIESPGLTSSLAIGKYISEHI